MDNTNNISWGESVAGSKLMEAGTAHWAAPNTGATNVTSFTALPGGWRSFSYGTFGYIGTMGNWWSVTEMSSFSVNAYSRNMWSNNNVVTKYNYDKRYGFSVRCLKD